MKTVGFNKPVVLTEKLAKYWISHQANQRAVIDRHVNALAKLMARVGWRMDQRICITEDNRIINGLQRLSAIIKLGDYGWKIPVTVFSNEEMTSDLIESFNTQKSDGLPNLMRREFGWTDKRMTGICTGMWCLLEIRQNITTKDALAIYEGTRKHFDKVLTVKEKKATGSRSIPADVSAAAILCGLDGMPLDRFIDIANAYNNDDLSSVFWKRLKEWDLYWRKQKDPNGKPITRELGNRSTHIVLRYAILKDFLLGKSVRSVRGIYEDGIESISSHCKEILRSNI